MYNSRKELIEMSKKSGTKDKNFDRDKYERAKDNARKIKTGRRDNKINPRRIVGE